MAKQERRAEAVGLVNSFAALTPSVGSTWPNYKTTSGTYPAVQWQDTTSNATYCSASAALAGG